MKRPKNIHLSEEAIKALSIQAIENGTNFKNYVESKLEALAQTSYSFEKTEKGEKKKKKKNAV